MTNLKGLLKKLFTPSARLSHRTKFVYNLVYLITGSVIIYILVPHVAKNWGLKPNEYTLGIGNASFTFKYPANDSSLTHLYVGAAGGVENGKNEQSLYPQSWSPWTDSGIEVDRDQCLRIKATGTVHLSLRRIVSEKLRPELLLLKDPESPNYVGPNGTSNYDVTSHQLFLQSYSLSPNSTLGTLIAKIKTDDHSDEIIKIGASKAYRVPKNKAGTLEFAVNDISFRDKDFHSIRSEDGCAVPLANLCQPAPVNHNIQDEMKAAWMGGYMPRLEDAIVFLKENNNKADNKADNKILKDQTKFVRNFYFKEVEYREVYDHGLAEWRKKASPEYLLEKARSLYAYRNQIWESIRPRNVDIWYKDNLGGFWVTVEKLPPDANCEIQN
jgi:hypothetical protein